jgi:hypothetical protein
MNRLKPYSEEIIAEEQEDIRNGRSSAEQILNNHIFCEKYLLGQHVLFHVFIYFNDAAIWATINKYTTGRKLFHTSNILCQDMSFKRKSSNYKIINKSSFNLNINAFLGG